jgi:lambda family phage portal protein
MMAEQRAPLGQRLNRAWRQLRGQEGLFLSPREIRSMFAGAAVTRLNADWVSSCLPADDELRWDLKVMRGRARELMRNNPIAEGYFNMLETNIIGPDDVGLEMQVRNRRGNLVEEVNAAIEAGWERFWRRPTVDGELSGSAYSRLTLRNTACDGEVLVRKHVGFDNDFAFGLQAIDADLLDEGMNQEARAGQPQVVMSVALDVYRRRLGYYVSTRAPGFGSSTPREQRYIPAREILHLGEPRRLNQTRYATWLGPVMDDLHMMGGYLEAAVVAARTAAAIPGAIQRRSESDSSVGTRKPDASQPVGVAADPGTFFWTPEGYEVSQWRPDHPKAELPGFVKECLRRIATGLHVSYYALANDVENFSYSSGRIQLLPERDEWKRIQQWWINKFLQPVFEEWLVCALAKGALGIQVSDPRLLFEAVRWRPRRWGWVDPSADMEANRDGIELLLTSPQRIVAEQGGDWEEILREQAQARQMAAAANVPFPAPAGTAAPAPASAPPPAGNGPPGGRRRFESRLMLQGIE